MKINKTQPETVNCPQYEIITGHIYDVITWLEQIELPVLIVHGDFGIHLKTDGDRNLFEYGLRMGAVLLNDRLQAGRET